MPKNRETQHKPDRDAAKNKEIQDLKSENRTLKKQVNRLRKQILQLMHNYTQSEVVAQEEMAHTKKKEVKGDRCDSCGSKEIKTVSLPHGTIIRCQACLQTKTVRK